MWLLALFLGVAFVYVLSGYIFDKNWQKGLAVRIAFDETGINEGESSTLSEEITNDKNLPIPALSVRISVNKNLRFSGISEVNTSVSDQSYKRDFFSLPFRARVKRKLEFKALRRGYYELGSVNIIAYDHFLNGGNHHDVDVKSSIYVYPRTVDVSRIKYISSAISGMLLTKRNILPDPFAFAGIREYAKGDSMSIINWKASAKNGELLVNQFDSTTAQDIIILLDMRDDNILKEESLVEESIRITAALCKNLIAGGQRLTLRCTNSSLDMDISAGSGSYDDVLKAMAVVNANENDRTLSDIIEGQSGIKGNDLIYVVISKNRSEEMKQLLSTLEKKGQYVWVLPYSPSRKEEASAYISKKCIGWEV